MLTAFLKKYKYFMLFTLHHSLLVMLTVEMKVMEMQLTVKTNKIISESERELSKQSRGTNKQYSIFH